MTLGECWLAYCCHSGPMSATTAMQPIESHYKDTITKWFCFPQPLGLIWLGGLDSNQDSQIQSLESYQLDDLPVENRALNYSMGCIGGSNGPI